MLIDETLVGVQLADRISVPTSRTINDQGQMIVPCSFARTGSQLYTAGQLGLQDVDSNKIITVYRDEKDVFCQDAMDSFRSAPVTIGHPKDDKGIPIKVTSINSKELQVGALEGMPVRDEDTLGGVLVLTNQIAIDTLEEGKQELSAGYTCDIEELDGKLYQRNIRANHIAIVDKGRAGSSCRISDEALTIKLADHQEQPYSWDFDNEAAYKEAYKSWIAAEYLEYYGSTDAEGKASGNTGMVDENLLTDAQEQVVTVTSELSVQKELVVSMKQTADKSELAVESLKIELVDAKLAASQGVIERCEAIEHARLIADMRDLGDKSVAEIRKLVVEDQYPNKDLSQKSEAFIEAMFEMLVDQAKGETPMSKILAKQTTHVTVDAVYVCPVELARKKMIATQKKQSK